MKITKSKLENDELLDKVLNRLADYPLYIAKSNISRGEAFAIWEILRSGLDNFTEFEIIIRKGK